MLGHITVHMYFKSKQTHTHTYIFIFIISFLDADKKWVTYMDRQGWQQYYILHNQFILR